MVRHDIRVQHLRLLSVERGWEGVGFWGLPFSRFLSVVTLLNNCLLCRHARINNTHNWVLSVNEIYVSLVSYWPFSVIVDIPIFFVFFLFIYFIHLQWFIVEVESQSMVNPSFRFIYTRDFFYNHFHVTLLVFHFFRFSFFFFLGSGFSCPIWVCILRRILIFCFF